MLFSAKMKVRFGDIDEAGIVYYPRFLHYFHVALEEFFEKELKVDYPTLIKQHRIGFPTVRLETDFRKTLCYGDQIEIEVSVLKIGRTSVQWRYRTFKEDKEQIINEGSNITVCLNMDTFGKMQIPQWLKEKLEKNMVN